MHSERKSCFSIFICYCKISLIYYVHSYKHIIISHFPNYNMVVCNRMQNIILNFKLTHYQKLSVPAGEPETRCVVLIIHRPIIINILGVP